MIFLILVASLSGICYGNVLDQVVGLKDQVGSQINRIPVVGELLNNTGFVWRFYKEENSDRSVEILNFTTPIGILKGEYCYVYGDNHIINQLLKIVPFKKTVNESEMEALIDKCTEIFAANILRGSVIPSVLLDLPGGLFRRLFIFPGTRWCGAGNISRHNNIGPAIETDKCCREHDHCNDSIPSHSSKYGLENTTPITKSNCDCDNKFYQCLKGDDSFIANSVGTMYFNILAMQCFLEEYPLKCVQKSWLQLGKCSKYERDQTKPKEWQFVDPKKYEPGTKDENLTRMFAEYR